MANDASDTRRSAPPPHISDHKLIRRIGRGSYGEVWLARTMMGTFRAVKIVYRHAFENTRPFERELAGIRKFEPVSRSHDGFIDVLQAGQNTAEGYFYYVMELGDDQANGQQIQPESYRPKTLAKEIARQRMVPIVECRRIGLLLSEALEHLHKAGLVHRDIKPSNIIFVNGAPKLADIGLVTDIQEAASFVGTEEFIPPEGPGTAQADIYSLGKVLYEASTGKDRHDFPALPAQLGDFTDSTPFLELNEVIVKACQNDRQKRYQSAEEIHADLVVLQSGKSVKRLRLLERRWAAVRRFGSLGVVSAAVLAGASLYLAAEHQRAAEARQRQVGTQVANGVHDLEQGDLPGALPSFVEALRLDQGDPRRERTHRLRLGAVLGQCPKLVQFWARDKRVNWVQFSPDGGRIATALWDGQAQVWDVTTGQAVTPPLGRTAGANAAAFSPDGRRVAVANPDNAARIWDLAGTSQRVKLEHSNNVTRAAFSPDGQRLLTTCEDQKARVWKIAAGQVIVEYAQHEAMVLHGAYSPDGRSIVTAGRDNAAHVWEADTGTRTLPLLRHKSWVVSAGFSPDGHRVVTASLDRTTRVWDARTGQEILPPMRHADGVAGAEFSPDGGCIVTACWDGTARLWDATTHQPLALNPILRHSGRVMRAAFSPDGHRIVTGCVDGTVRVWDLAGSGWLPQPVRGAPSHDGSRSVVSTNNRVQVRDVVGDAVYARIVVAGSIQESRLSENGHFVLTVSVPAAPSGDSNRHLQVWTVSSGKPASPSIPFPGSLSNVCLSLDGRRLAWVTDKRAQIHDVASGLATAPPLGHDRPVALLRFSPAADRLVTVAQSPESWRSDARVHVWNVATGQPLFAPLPHRDRVAHAEFSPDGHFLLTCTADEYLSEHAAQVWNAATGERVGRPLEHRDGVLHATFSPDGRRVVTASEDFTAAVWDATSGRRLAPPLRHENQVEDAVFSQDGRWIVSVGPDRTARIWDAETGDPLSPPLRHAVIPRRARFVARDSKVLAVDDRQQSWLWDLPYERRSVEVLAQLAQLLTGAQTAGVGVVGDPPARAQRMLVVAWQQLSQARAEDLHVARDEILSWHRSHAELCEENRQWFSACFHLQQLLVLQPEDPELARRLALAQAQLRKE
jgi:WD40 repeat protein